VTVVIRRDLREAFEPIRHQGDRPTCLAFALSDAHGVARLAGEEMSPEHLYYHAVQRTAGCHPDDGVSLPEALDALRLDGQCCETGWPYTASLPSDLSSWKPPATATPIFRRKTQPLSREVAAIVRHLDSGEPVVLTLLLGLRFYEPPGGLVAPGSDDADTAYHAVIAVGHGHTPDGETCILVRNSWGTGWAIEGYGWITASYLDARLSDAVLMPSENAP